LAVFFFFLTLAPLALLSFFPSFFLWGQLELALQMGNHGNEALIVRGFRALHLSRDEVGKLCFCLGNEFLMGKIGSEVAIVIIILLLGNVLLEIVVGMTKYASKSLVMGSSRVEPLERI
jgi:hypothetical protein